MIVDNNPNDDNSVMGMHENDSTMLDIFSGDSVLVKGKRKKETVLIVTSGPGGEASCEEGKVRVNSSIRKNLGVKLGDVVGIHKVDNIPYGTTVQVLPFADSVEGITGNLFEDWLKPYFSQAYRPVMVNDTFVVRGNMRAIEFKVIAVEVGGQAAPYCIVSPDTGIFCEGTVEYESELENLGYDDVGGCGEALAAIREVVELPIHHPDLFKNAGVKPPSGVLLFGPTGTGKTRIARAVANETACSFFLINGPEIMSGIMGKAEENLRSVFAKAHDESPSIIFIDEFDAIAPKRGAALGEVERRVVSTLMSLMGGAKDMGRSKVIVIAATNRLDAIDTSLRQFGRLGREVRTCARSQRLPTVGAH